MNTTIKAALAALSLSLLSACAPLALSRAPNPELASLRLFAHDLGSTHAGLAACSNVAPDELLAHRESALLALRAQAGARLADVSPDFEKGLQEPAGLGGRLHVACSCAQALVTESRQHNLSLFREAQIPEVLRRGR